MRPINGEYVARAINSVLGISQEEIARLVGVSHATVSAWVNGRAFPRAANAKQLEALLESECARFEGGALKTKPVLAKLESLYGSPRLGSSKSPLDELFFALLALKTSFSVCQDVFEAFSADYRPWAKLLNASEEDISACIRKGGLGSIKSRSFIDIAKRLQSDFKRVSLSKLRTWSTEKAEKYLMSLPGVGQKTARRVLMYAFGRDIVPVDTDTYRVADRLGIVSASKSTADAHKQFDAIVPQGLAYALHANFLALGQEYCLDRAPKCEACPVSSLCGYAASLRKAAKCQQPPPHLYPERRTSDEPMAIDIYAGCGGLSKGIEDAGFRVAYALDWDENACETHRINAPDTIVQCADVRSVRGEEIQRQVGRRIDLVAGGPNCQGVSERGLRNPDDPRNFMFPEFVRIVSEIRPSYFLMENVPGLAHRHNYDILKTVFRSFQELGYNCAADVLLAAEYGVPQLRYRLFLIGTLESRPLTFPTPTHTADSGTLFGVPFVNVGNALGDLPAIDADHQHDISLPYAEAVASTEFRRYARGESDAVNNHCCSATQSINLRRASYIPEGGNWKNIPAELLPDRFFMCRMTDHSTTYYRLRRDQPGFTITSLFGNITAGAFTHPTSNRALSIREGARLQTFRDRFIFTGPRNSQYRQIGNAVPPLLSKAVASHILALLNGERISGFAPRITPDTLNDKRSWDALPVLTPRFKKLFGTGTRWPIGWGPQPDEYSELLDSNYSLRPEFWPEGLRKRHRKALADSKN
jgi:DNA-cytosine methyltransferase